MDIVNILSSIKGKVLDATNFDLLKHAYELQNENVTQLKTNNEALKESHDLLKEKVCGLKKEIGELNVLVTELKKKVGDGNLSQPNFSDAGLEILQLYGSKDKSRLYSEEIIRELSSKFKRVQVEAGISELRQAKLLDFNATHPSHGTNYYLTGIGKTYVAKNQT